jgi:hypothetical protein
MIMDSPLTACAHPRASPHPCASPHSHASPHPCASAYPHASALSHASPHLCALILAILNGPQMCSEAQESTKRRRVGTADSYSYLI